MRRAPIFLLALLLGTGATATQAKDAPDLRTRIDALAKPFLDAGTVVGMTVGVLEGGERHVFGYGKLGAGNDTLPDGRTVYEIGSITKVFTGILLADLVRDGTVKLDQPVQELLPEGVTVPTKGDQPITLRHLATHTSGLPRMPSNFEPQDPKNPYADYDAKRLYAGVQSAQLQSRPGTAYAYSNLGVGLLAHALARAAGKPYEVLLRERILDPLGMRDTAITLTDSMKERLAPGHLAHGVPTPSWDFDAFAGAGAIRSTVDDMLTFLEANLAGGQTPLTASLAQARELYAEPAGQPVKMGLGWHFGLAPGGRWHNGETGGYHSHAGLLLENDIAIVVLANTATGKVDQLGSLLYPLLVGKEVEPPTFDDEVTIDPQILDDYVGRYALAPTFTLTVTRDGDRLMVQATGQENFPVFPLGDDQFFYRVVEAKLHFQRDADGDVKGVVLHQGGRAMPAARLD